jgi:hypothetical protein
MSPFAKHVKGREYLALQEVITGNTPPPVYERSTENITSKHLQHKYKK